MKRFTYTCLALLAVHWANGAHGDQHQALEAHFTPGLERLNQWLASADADLSLVETFPLDLGNLAKASFGKYYTELDRPERQRLLSHLGQRLSRDVARQLRDAGAQDLQLAVENADGKRPLLRFAGADLQGRLAKTDSGWHLVDFALEDQWLSKRYKTLCRPIIKGDYSLPVLLAKLDEREYIVIEDFSTSPVGGLPTGWGWREKDEKKEKPYTVQKMGDKHVLAAADTGNSVILLKYSHWNPRQFPIMTWCWRADALPPNGDEHFDQTNDSAAGIYVIFSRKWIKLLKQIKYVWSTTVPVGKVGRRDRFMRPYFFVAESGDENLGNWVFEQVDLVADHKRVMEGDLPAKRTIGIGILSDANSTKSLAKAYYADLRVWSRKAQEQGLIKNYCGCDAFGSTGSATTVGDQAAKENE